MSTKKRVLICGLAQESNSFNPVTMGMESFRPSSTETCGYENIKGGREYLLANDAECIFDLVMRTNSGGPVSERRRPLRETETITSPSVSA